MLKSILTAALLLLSGGFSTMAQAPAALVAPTIIVETEHVSLVLSVGANHKLYQRYLGAKLASAADYAPLPFRHEAYVPAGTDNLFEPALRIVHADGNPSLALEFVDVQTQPIADGVANTTIRLRDPKYPVDVQLHFVAYAKEDVIKTWREVVHRE